VNLEEGKLGGREQGNQVVSSTDGGAQGGDLRERKETLSRRRERPSKLRTLYTTQPACLWGEGRGSHGKRNVGEIGKK